MFEIKHLKTIVMLEKTGNLRKTADALFMSHSALSHQIKELENKLGNVVFIRNSTPICFTDAGNLLLKLAKDILPHINQVTLQLKGKALAPRSFKVAISCHACFQWLLPVTDYVKSNIAEVEITFIDDNFSQSALTEIDLLFTDEKHEDQQWLYQCIGEFEVVAVIAKNHPLANKEHLDENDFINETLLSYPINYTQLDVYRHFLITKNITPANIKKVSNSHMILQMVAANMGITALPDWLVTSLINQSLVKSKRLGNKGVHKKLYAKYPKNSQHNDIIEQLIPRAKIAFTKLYPLTSE